MKRALLLAVAVAGCATTPLSRTETDELRPVPRNAETALASRTSAPSVVPSEQSDAAKKLLADVHARGVATLTDCFALAEATHEDLLSGEEDRLQAALQRDLAFAGLLPSVGLNAFAFVKDRTSTSGDSSSSGGGSFGGGSSRPSTTGRDTERWAIAVRQPLFRGFAEWRAMEQAGLTEESRVAAIETMRNALRRSTARAFYGVLEAEADVRTLEGSEKLDRTRLDEMKAREEHGIARRTEVLLLESQLQSTLGALRRARTQRLVTRTTLFQLLGVELPTPIVDRPPAAPSALPTRGAAVAEALRARPEIAAAGLSAEAAEKAIEVARAGYWPSIDFNVNWYLGSSGVSRQTKDTDWDAQVSLDLPIFEGAATATRERIAKSDARKARLAASSTLRDVVQDVESALARAAADAELLATFERNVQIATENVTLLREEYAHGVATNLEVLTAQNVLQQAQIDLERQRLETRLDRVELSIALGRREIER
jgi:outer membrane protein